MIQKLLILILLVSCSSIPKKQAFNDVLSDSHPECKLDISSPRISFLDSSSDYIFRGIKTTGSLMLTTLGYTSDTILISAGLAGSIWTYPIFYQYAGHIFVGYLGMLKNFELISSGEKIYDGTTQWRCPNVDHVSQSIREVAECNIHHSHYIAAFSQLEQLKLIPILNQCLSAVEKLKAEELLAKMKSESAKRN